MAVAKAVDHEGKGEVRRGEGVAADKVVEVVEGGVTDQRGGVENVGEVAGVEGDIAEVQVHTEIARREGANEGPQFWKTGYLKL